MSLASHVHRGLESLCSFEVICFPLIQCARVWDWFIFNKRESTNTRPPSITKRARSLSISSSEDEDHMTTYWQERSLWFRLPLELREEVYKHYIGDGETWVALRFDGMIKGARKTDDGANDDPNDPTWQNMDVLPLFTTCRRIYSEALPILYTHSHFHFPNPASFLLFSSSIPRSRWDLLHRLTLHFLPRRNFWYLCDSFLNQELHFSYLPTGLPWELSTPWARPTSKAKEYVRKQLFFSELPKGKEVPCFRWCERSSARGKTTKATFWSTCCKVLEEMNGLRELKIHARDVEFLNTFLERQWTRESAGLNMVKLLDDVQVADFELRVIHYCNIDAGQWLIWTRVVEDGVREWKARQVSHDFVGQCKVCEF